uniref:Secreted RxLR effector protein 66 n=1 Tax=Plasmopara viticola TaxID=143451 RepID=RLR66_PLAVT|nr:RecName: Full=Secreted RxLR effector protein 66; Flags: Precursor [Plasmopara viticola]ANC73386.1 secreted RxLR effector peptide protein 66 [Plasmopara viticola]
MHLRLLMSTVITATLIVSNNALTSPSDKTKTRALRGASTVGIAADNLLAAHFSPTLKHKESRGDYNNIQTERHRKRRLYDAPHHPEFYDIAVHQVPSDKSYGGGPAIAIFAGVAATFILIDYLIRHFTEN